MSVSPAQNFSKPPPVPEVPTVMRTPGLSSWKISAATVVSGPTVLEPSTRIVPLNDLAAPPLAVVPASSLPASEPPQAVNVAAMAAVASPRLRRRESFVVT